MKCSEFQELAAAYALDALSEAERLACAAHLEHEGPHDGCETLLARYERTVSALSDGLPSAPVDSGVWRAIEARLGTRNAPSAEADSPRPSARVRPREVIAWALAAAALLGGAWTLQQAAEQRAESERQRAVLSARAEALVRERGELTSRVDVSEAARAECAEALARLGERTALVPLALSLLEHPGTKVQPMVQTGARPLRATALYNRERAQALVVSSSLEPIAGKDYELWVITGKAAPRPAGFVRFDESGVAVGEFDAALLRGRPDALAVSLEPAGGRPTPTEVVLLATLRG